MSVCSLATSAWLGGTGFLLPSLAQLWGWTAVGPPWERAELRCAKELGSAWSSGLAPFEGVSL